MRAAARRGDAGLLGKHDELHLDGFVLMGVAAWLIDKMMLPDPAAVPVTVPLASPPAPPVTSAAHCIPRNPAKAP